MRLEFVMVSLQNSRAVHTDAVSTGVSSDLSDNGKYSKKHMEKGQF